MVHLSLHLLFKQLSKIPMICTLSPGEAEALLPTNPVIKVLNDAALCELLSANCYDDY